MLVEDNIPIKNIENILLKNSVSSFTIDITEYILNYISSYLTKQELKDLILDLIQKTFDNKKYTFMFYLIKYFNNNIDSIDNNIIENITPSILFSALLESIDSKYIKIYDILLPDFINTKFIVKVLSIAIKINVIRVYEYLINKINKTDNYLNFLIIYKTIKHDNINIFNNYLNYIELDKESILFLSEIINYYYPNRSDYMIHLNKKMNYYSERIDFTTQFSEKNRKCYYNMILKKYLDMVINDNRSGLTCQLLNIMEKQDQIELYNIFYYLLSNNKIKIFNKFIKTRL